MSTYLGHFLCILMNSILTMVSYIIRTCDVGYVSRVSMPTVNNYKISATYEVDVISQSRYVFMYN